MEILVAVKDRFARSALKDLIKYNFCKDTIRDTGDNLSFLEQLRNSETEVVIIEWGFFFRENPEMLPLLKKAYPKISFIVTGISRQNQKDAFEANMDAFFMQSDAPEKLLDLINSFREIVNN